MRLSLRLIFGDLWDYFVMGWVVRLTLWGGLGMLSGEWVVGLLALCAIALLTWWFWQCNRAYASLWQSKLVANAPYKKPDRAQSNFVVEM